MTLVARLAAGETLGDRVLKVDHAGEHGAVCIYRSQRFFARWRAPKMVQEIDEFIVHERGHRARFEAELTNRKRARCRSYHFCGLGGLVLGAVTGLAGKDAINATTVAIERVVLRHMREQIVELKSSDPRVAAILRDIVEEEQEHHDISVAQLPASGFWQKSLGQLVSASTEVVIWLGMRL